MHEIVVIGSIAGLAILVSGGIALMVLDSRKKEEEEKKQPTTVVNVDQTRPRYAFPRYVGRPFPDPFISRHGSKWGMGIWDHRNPFHHKHY